MDDLHFCESDLLGVVESVDTGSINIFIENEEHLKSLQVNQLVAIQSSRVNQQLIGLVTRIIRKSIADEDRPDEIPVSYNSVRITLIGTHYAIDGLEKNVFKRSLAVVPSINAECYVLQSEKLKFFMGAITNQSQNGKAALKIGTYNIDDEATAWLNGNRFFQRHAVIVGSTGSGKSCCVANILEQIAELKSANAVLFDIHGEYTPLVGKNFRQYKIAGPNDLFSDETIFLPYWLLNYDEMLSLMLDRSDTNAPNQAMAFSAAVITRKQEFLNAMDKKELADQITLDSPIPYKLLGLIDDLKELDSEMVPGARTDKQGPLYGKLTRFIQRLSTKKQDKRLNFMFSNDDNLMEYDFMEDLCKKILEPAVDCERGIKIIDFSEVPSDILPLIVSMIARLIFSIQQWTESEKRNPIAIFCDEAHLYIPCAADTTINQASLSTFERISKEGRKYGVGLVVITQRPSEVNRTVLSQCNNFIAMRLTNADDQSVVKRLFPDNLGDFSEVLPILDVGEAIIVGDSCLLPSRIKVQCPTRKPKSQTVDFWNIWAKNDSNATINASVNALRRQSK